jgi:phenylacetic acid degradation operon negative regulatory protein
LEPLREELPPNAVLAFHARELPGYPVVESVKAAWDIEAIRSEHLSFIKTWTGSPSANAGTALSTRAMLVADWLALLRVDPRLPREFMDAQWPASRSYKTYRRVHDALAADADAEFRALLTQKPTEARPKTRRGPAVQRQDVARAGRVVR